MSVISELFLLSITVLRVSPPRHISTIPNADTIVPCHHPSPSLLSGPVKESTQSPAVWPHSNVLTCDWWGYYSTVTGKLPVYSVFLAVTILPPEEPSSTRHTNKNRRKHEEIIIHMMAMSRGREGNNFSDERIQIWILFAKDPFYE